MKRIFLILVVWSLAISFNYGQGIKTDASVPKSFGYSKTIGTTWTDTLSRELDTLAQVAAGHLNIATCNTLFYTTASDTLTTGVTLFTQYWTASILTDDTLEVSTSGTFPAYDKTIVLPDVPLTVGTYNKSKTNLYIRRYTGASVPAGSPNYYIYVWGW